MKFIYHEKFWLLLSLILNLLFLSVMLGSSRSPTNILMTTRTIGTRAHSERREKIIIHGQLRLNRANDGIEVDDKILHDDTTHAVDTLDTVTKIVDKSEKSRSVIKQDNKNIKAKNSGKKQDNKPKEDKSKNNNIKHKKKDYLNMKFTGFENVTTIRNMSSFQVNHLTNRPSAVPCQDDVYLIMVINSSPYNGKRRMDIRRTWGNTTAVTMLSKYKQKIRIVFIIGKANRKQLDESVERESQEFGDLVLADFADNTRNLTDKTLLGMLWQLKFCHKAKFFYKGDDDVFVNTYRLIQYVDSLDSQHKKRYLVGRVHTSNRVPCRVKKHKYYVSYKDYPRRRFPPYCSGFAYLMTSDCVGLLTRQVKKVKLLKSIDDVYIGLLAEAAGIRPFANNRRFHFFHPAIPKNHVFTVAEINLRIAEHGIISYDKHRKLLDMAVKGLGIYT